MNAYRQHSPQLNEWLKNGMTNAHSISSFSHQLSYRASDEWNCWMERSNGVNNACRGQQRFIYFFIHYIHCETNSLAAAWVNSFLNHKLIPAWAEFNLLLMNVIDEMQWFTSVNCLLHSMHSFRNQLHSVNEKIL